ncbi:MAG: M6 family metalloprotease domain-containing protein, partial [Verrucomicrobia bacterium]|nr:M6 family metalloprotease domain-containing protein [Verrucomicrobiota bacterium]
MTSVSAAPFDEQIQFTQPDGTLVNLHGWGNDFHAVFETLDGYTVVFDQTRKAYCYARLTANGELVSTGAEVHRCNPSTLGLNKGLRMSVEVQKREARVRYQQWEARMQIQPQWEARKAAMRRLRKQQVQAAAGAAGFEAGTSAGVGSSLLSLTTTGVKVGLTMLIDFTDDVATVPQTNIVAYCNADGYTGYGNNGSVKEYYYEVSGGKLTYTNVVTCYIRAPHPKSYYNDTSGTPGLPGPGDLVKDCIGVMTTMPNYATEILPMLEALTVDDSNNIVACNVFFAGANSGVWAKGLWPCSSSFGTPIPLLGTVKKVRRWQISNIGTSLVIGTFCHENGHMLCGLPDIYDYGGDSRGGAGAFCIMDSGGPGTNPVQFCAYLKRAAGWATTTDIPLGSSQTVSVSSSGPDFNHFYRYSKPGVSTEYFLVENRQKSGRDISLPAAGIAIWHIDEMGNKDNQSLTNNFTHANYEATLVQADNLWHFERNVNSGDTNDLYYADNTAAGYNNEFTDYSTPNAHWWDGTISGARFRDFSANGSTMTFTVVGWDAPIEDGATVVVNGITVNNPGDYMVGSNGSFYALIITNAGGLAVTNDSIIGNSPYSSNNLACVTGAGSVWTSGTNLYVGAFGANNSLTIADGGHVFDVGGYVGLGADANSNSVLITDASSLWNNSGYALQIGSAGSFNQMTILNGGAVASSNSSVGAALGATSNTVLVSDSGSVWTNSGSLSIGNVGSENALTITNGGRVFNNFAYIGVASGSVNNAVVVTGAGSFWRNASSLYVGSNASGNSLSIASGGQVTDVGGYIGYTAMSSNNAVFVSGAGSAWTNSSSLYVGNSGSGNDLTISDGARVNNTSGYIGNNSSASNNSVLVTDAESVWTNSSSLYVGNSGSSNSLVIANGGQVFNGYAYIGSGSSASNNSALITGVGSTWNSVNNFFVGNNGSGGSLIITNGGRVNVSGGGNIGSAASSTNNVVVVAGIGSVWSNGSSAYVGVSGSRNNLTITDGGTVIDTMGHVGFNRTASNNTALVTGSGSLWTNTRNLYVGNGGIGNLLGISDGGQVVSVTGFVGFLSVSTNNAVLVSDPGTLWNNLADLCVGGTGSFNLLTITNGGMVVAAADAYVGYAGGASNNWTVVAGSGSVWSNAGVLTVGRGGRGNGVTLADGGQVYAAVFSNLNGSIFSMSGGNAYFPRVYNSATISQSGGLFDPDFFDNGGLLQITGGTNIATVFLNEASGIVEQSGGEHSVNYATNFGSWTLSGGVANLTNFINEAGAQLIGAAGVLNGSITSAGTLSFGSSPNMFSVTGDVTLLPGALTTMKAGGTNFNLLDRLALSGLLTVGGTLKVSLQGGYAPQVGDVLDLFDYGVVAGGFDHLKLPAQRGYDWDTSHLLAAPADPLSGTVIFNLLAGGSLTNIIDGIVTNAGGVYVFGDHTSMNDLIITNVGVLIDTSGILGNQSTSRYNLAIVTGAGSVWSNSADLYVGYGGFGNQMILTNGGTTLAGNAYVGYEATASNNTVIVAGAGSVWSNAGVLTVGRGGTDSGVMLADGGRIYAAVLSNLNDSIFTMSGGSLFVPQVYNAATITQGGGLFDPDFFDNAGLLQITNGTNIASVFLNETFGIAEQSGGGHYIGAGTNWGVWTVSGGSLHATNNSASGLLGSLGGTLTLNGGNIVADRLVITNSVFNFNNGALTTRGGQIVMPASSNLFIGTTPDQAATWNVLGGTTIVRWTGGAGETVLGGVPGVTSILNVSGLGTVWSNSSANLEIGMQSGGNLLTISEGACAFNLTGIVGNSTLATNNGIIVSGTGSMWSNASNLIIGNNSGSNSLAVASGGTVVSSAGYIGWNDTASNNSVQISDAGSLWRNTSVLYVGYGGQGNSLTITGGARVFNTYGYIGNNSTAGSNIAVVTGLGSLWSNNSSLIIGPNGRVNSLFIINGGNVFNGLGVIGSGSSASSNVVLVSDANSVWSNSSILQIGLSGFGNNLTIANGGRVFDTSGRVGLNSGANNNGVLVTDPGSLWSHSGELLLGSNAYGNQLVITNGGQVFSASGTIGYTNKYNSALVTGTGSLWSNAGSLFIGYWGTTNSLTIADGGTVIATNLIVGVTAGLVGNAVTNTGGDLIVTNNTTSARLEIRGGSLTFNGGSITTDMLVATNNTYSTTNSILDFNAGTLTTRGDSQIISPGSNNFVIGGLAGATAVWNVLGGTNLVRQLPGSTSNTVLGGLAAATGTVNVAGNGTVWSNANNLWVGGASAGNQLVVTNSARAVNNHGYLGYSSVASSNSALVSGPGSLWSNIGNLYVGNSSFSNSLIISNGGVVFDTNAYVGNNSSASNNLVLVTDSGSLWRNNGTLYVGNSGKGDGLTIANGGRVVNTYGYVGNASSANGNFVLVQDAGSLWSNSSTLYIGASGSSNSLTITRGGKVLNSSAYIGNNVVSSDNSVLVEGMGSVWSNSSSLTVGNSGSANSLTILDGAQLVSGSSVTVGSGSNSHDNSLYVSSAGYLASVGLSIGNAGARSNSISVLTNTLWNLRGGVLIWGGGIGSISNSLTIDETSALTNIVGLTLGDEFTTFYMTNSAGGGVLNGFTTNQLRFLPSGIGSLTVGPGGSRNTTLTISNYLLRTTTGYAGYSGTNDAVFVIGPDATWSNSSSLYVGYSGGSNNLTVTNSGQVFNTYSYIGSSSTASNNAVLVSGNGSLWRNSGDLNVGSSGSSNSLTITDGGQVFSSYGYIGNNSTASNNVVLVTDAGSVWNNTNNLVVGNSGFGNSLIISNGGLVFNSYGTIGNNSSASNNSVLVTDAGSMWNNTNNLVVGSSGFGNSLIISNGGLVFNGFGNSLIISNGGLVFNSSAYIGNNSSASNNSVLVTDVGSVWNNTNNLLVGNSGSGNSLIISNGGLVFNSSAYIGNNSAASNNVVLVTGAGSVWTNNGSLYVGNFGSSNQLTINNSGTVVVGGKGYVGYAAGSSGGLMIDGANSILWGGLSVANNPASTGSVTVANSGLLEVWSNLTLGTSGGLTNRDGSVVRLVSNATVSVSGSFVVTNATLEFAGASTGSTPFLSGVTFRNGAGVKWAGYGGDFGDHAITDNLNLDLTSSPGLMRGIVDNARLTVGGGSGLLYVGSNNLASLTITNGAQVLDSIGYVGFDTASSNNSALVSGPGSVWNNSDSIFVGYHGPLAALTLTNGGTVLATNIVVGFDSSSTGNVITVNGGRLYATNADGGGALDVRYGALTFNSGTVTVDRLLLTNGLNSIFNFNGGVLNAAEMRSTQPVTVNGGTLALADSFMNLSESTFELNSGSVIVPNVGVNLGAFIQNGGLFDPAVFTNSGSWTLTGGTNVDGVFLNMASGTMLQRGGEHDANFATNFGSWTISGGVANLTNFVNEDHATLTVSGGTLNGSLTIGNTGSFNQLTVTNGGVVVGGTGMVGNSSLSSNNSVLVTSDGSLWSNNSSLYVGYAGVFNNMTVTNGGSVISASVVIGDRAGANSNTVLVSGPGSSWNSSGTFTVGNVGAYNALVINNNGCVINGAGGLGSWSGGNNNMALVTGSGSTWSNRGDLSIGHYYSSFNALIVTNGAKVTSYAGYIGTYSVNNGYTEDSNMVLVTGSGSTWSNRDNLSVGYRSSGNSLTIANGGFVVNNGAAIGEGTTLGSVSNNAVLVTGRGTIWANSGGLTVGSLSPGNSLTISDGGLVVNGGATLGSGTVGNNNKVLVTDIGTTWSNNGPIYVGHDGSGNSLTISNGGCVINGEGCIGRFPSSSNTVVVADGASVWSNQSQLTIGNFGWGNSLTIANGGHVFSSNGALSANAFSSNNSVQVTGAGSMWANSGTLWVGGWGPSNSLTIGNGALVANVDAYVGAGNNSGSNLVLVTGPGSTWSNLGTLYVGNGNPANSLIIADGGRVTSVNGRVGNYASSGGGGNSVLVAGSGSLWTNSGQLYVGYVNSSNTLTIANGGRVIDVDGSIGYNSSSSNNAVLVTDSGSRWMNTINLNVGSDGPNNQLTVSNNGTVSAPNIAIGANASSTGNTITVTGGNLYGTNASGTGWLDIRRGALTLNSGTVVVDHLFATNFASSIVNINGGNLTAPVLLNAGQFTMTGGTLSVSSAFTNAAGGTFNLSGGSVFVPLQMNNLGTFIQSGGFFDPEVFTNSGSFTLSGGTNIAEVFLNLLGGTVQQSGGQHDVGYATNFGSWTVSSGVANLTNYVGEDNATLTVSGGILNGSLIIGNTGSFNQLTITNGGMIVGGTGVVGNASTSSNNWATVTGSGSVWTNSFDFSVGYSGAGNQLTITNGGKVYSKWGYVGYNSGASNNAVLVSGAGSVWKNDTDLFNNLSVGYSGAGNQLTITNSGKVYGGGVIGRYSSANNNAVLVSGAGSVWHADYSDLHVGYWGSSNQLMITDGGAVYNGYGHIGWIAGANSNTVTVTGASSVWNNNGQFEVGSAGAGNQLTIANGGTVYNTYGYIGHEIGSSNNAVLVTDTGSIWTNSSNLSVGYYGAGNQLTISNSGGVYNTYGCIGWGNSAGANAVLVTGAGSVWNNSSWLYVGYAGSSNSLGITSNGSALATNVVIGYFASTGNVITVTGGNLYATNGTSRGVLDVRYGALTLNSGTVTANEFLATNFADSVVNFNGGTLNSGGSAVDNGSIFQVGNGTSAATLHLLGGTHSFANSLFINTNATLTGTGAITGSITNAGVIAPGDSAGILTGSGDLTLLANSLLLMQLAGTNDWLYDQINLTGAFNFGGALTLSLLDGFTASAGDRFDLFDFSSATGAFSLTNLPGLEPTLYWDTSSLYITGEIEADQRTAGIATPGTDVYPITNKPTAGSGINWNRPLSTGLVSAVPVNEGASTNFYDAVAQQSFQAVTLAGSPGGASPLAWFTPAVSSDYPWAGPAISNNGATAQAIQSSFQELDLINNVTNGYSYAVLVQPLDTNTFGRIMDATGAAVITTYLNTPGYPGQVATTWRNAAGTAVVPRVPFTTNQWMLVLCTVQDGLGMMYVNGAPVASNTTVNLAKSWTNQTGQLVYNATGNGSQMCNANFSSWWVWNNRVLTAQEAVQMYANPWAMFHSGSQKGFIKGTKVTLDTAAGVSNVVFYSHAAAGNVRLGIYDNASPKHLLWQSGSVTNIAANAWITVPITDGAPSSLSLAPGTYWIAWQVDSTADVPSYTAGSSGDGFYFAQSYGDYPATLSGEQSSSEKWSAYFSYEISLPVITTTSPLPDGTVGEAYSQILAAANGTPPYNWSTISGALPDGLTLSSAGVLSGMPTTANNFNFRVQVTDSASLSATQDFTLTVGNGPPLILTRVVSRKTHGTKGAFDLNLVLDAGTNGTVEPRLSGPTTLVFSFNKSVAATDGVLSANEFTLTNATYVSASIVS